MLYLDTLNDALRETLTVPKCDCGAVLYAGSCFAIGECETADRQAVRHSNRDRAKATMRAFTIRGGVD